jgi:RNA polymerase sigma factor FliA
MKQSEMDLWVRYRTDSDVEARTALLEQHLGLVHHIARQIAERVPEGVELDDLVSAGSLGLVLALESFDCERGLAFSTYATPRIRGAILDDLRSRDWVPRSVRAKSRQIAAAVRELQRHTGRHPEPREIAALLGLDLEVYHRWREDTENAVLLPIDGPVGLRREESATLEETLRRSDEEPVDANLTRSEQVDLLRDAINGLPAKERTVLSLYYYEEMNLRQIAEVLHLTESRISQIRSHALRRLQEIMEERGALV